MACGNVMPLLSEHAGDARPDTLIHLYVRDIDALAEELGVAVDEEGLAGGSGRCPRLPAPTLTLADSCLAWIRRREQPNEATPAMFRYGVRRAAAMGVLFVAMLAVLTVGLRAAAGAPTARPKEPEGRRLLHAEQAAASRPGATGVWRALQPWCTRIAALSALW